MALAGKNRVRSKSEALKVKVGRNVPGRTLAPPTRLALIRSVRLLQKVCVTKKVTPRVLIETVLRKWIQDVYPKLPVKGLYGDHHLADAAAVATFESQLRRLPFLEAAYWLSTAYTALSPK